MGISAALGSSALLPAGLGFRNLIINGDFRINQRAFSSTTTTASFGFDRWFGQWDGGTTTYSAQTFSLGNAIPDYEPINYARLVTTSQSSAAHYARLEQRIESVRSGAGRVVTLSFWAKAGSGTPKVAVELQQYFGTGGSPSTSVNTLAGQATLSTTWVRYTMTVTLPSISGKTIGSNNNDFLGLYFYVSAGSDFNSRTGSLGVQNNTFDFWGVQVEQNYQATPFEQRPIGVELQLCQRYYEKSYSVETAPATNTTSGLYHVSAATDGGGYVVMTIRFAVPKRTSSFTASGWSTGGSANVWEYGRSGVSGSGAITFDYLSTSGMRAYIATAGAWTAAQAYGHWAANAEL
jgi:hypothetical protein